MQNKETCPGTSKVKTQFYVTLSDGNGFQYCSSWNDPNQQRGGASICDAEFSESSCLCLDVEFFFLRIPRWICCTLHDSVALELIASLLLSVRFLEKQKCIAGINHGNGGGGKCTMSKIGLKYRICLEGRCFVCSLHRPAGFCGNPSDTVAVLVCKSIQVDVENVCHELRWVKFYPARKKFQFIWSSYHIGLILISALWCCVRRASCKYWQRSAFLIDVERHGSEFLATDPTNYCWQLIIG